MEVNDILNHVAHITAAPVWVCENGNESGLRFIRCYPVEGQKTEHPSQCILDLLTQRHSCGCPILASVGNVLYYALIPGNQERYLLGPVHLSAFLALRHAFPAEAGNLLNAGIAICDIPVFLYSALLVRNLFTDSPVTAEEVLASNCLDSKDIDIQRYYSKLVFSNREGGQQHNAYSQEFRLMSSIERGDVQMVKKCFQERVSGAFGTLAPTMERNARNLGISVTVLASRAAIRGGVNYEQAFSLCDSYIMQIETMQDLRLLQPLVESAQLNFATMVQTERSQPASRRDGFSHPLVEKCKNYTLTQLHGKITLSEVAQMLGTNPSYLSTLFKQYEGISFSDFVMREKINLAKSLLIYSQESYGQISATLGFSSQSHMGKHFKKLTGMTPIQFRQRYSKTEVSN